MYSPQMVALRRARLEETFRAILPRGLREYSVPEVQEYQLRMRDLFDSKDQMQRPLTPEEDAFVTNERLLGKVNFTYWAERYCTINLAGQTLGLLYPLWESQCLILGEIGRLEWSRHESGHPDGVVINVLKDRQVGASTLAIAICAHRLLTHAHIFGLLAADVPDASDYLWDMFERILDHLPWYMRPGVLERVKNDELVFDSESRLFWGASKSTRGADKPSRGATAEGRKGQLGRGKTISVCLNSEMATWVNPEQIDMSLKPGIPVTSFTFWMREGTGQGRGKSNWWWLEWQTAKTGHSRAVNIFIPWYAELARHHLPAPLDWTPNITTTAHAKRAEEQGPRWLHRPVSLTRDQLYWYESARTEAEKKEQLELFLQEHPADDEEAFQYSAYSVFPLLLRERIKAQMKSIRTMIDVRPQKDLYAA